METHISLKQMATIFGMTDRRVNQLAKEGIFKKISNGVYDLPASVQSYAEYLKTRHTAKRDNDIKSDKAKIDKLKADKLELEIAQKRGELVSANDVVAEWQSIITDTRAELLSIPSKLAALTPQQKETVDSAIRKSLEGMADA